MNILIYRPLDETRNGLAIVFYRGDSTVLYQLISDIEIVGTDYRYYPIDDIFKVATKGLGSPKLLSMSREKFDSQYMIQSDITVNEYYIGTRNMMDK